jgi:CubicO group peptidase (beta-lactamase class C family)
VVEVVEKVQGECSPDFALVSEMFQRSLASRDDLGGSVAITIDGELVVDLWGGTCPGSDLPWERETIANVWSISKPMTSMAVLVLADQHGIDLDDPVARYWPAFGQAGKADVRISDVMAHASGVAGWDHALVVRDLYDHEKLAALLELQVPWWPPGLTAGYHAFTHGTILGELVRRVSGVSLGSFLAQTITEPLGADFHIGLAERHDVRVTGLVLPPPLSADTWTPPFAIATRANPALTGAEPEEAAWRRAEIPSANGHGNARSVALVQAVLACGGELGGRRYFSETLARRVLLPRASGHDQVLGAPFTWALGYALPDHDNPTSPSRAAGFWGGMGGSHLLVDQEHRMTMSYVMNRMNNVLPGHDPRVRKLTVATYAALTGRRIS